MPADLASDPAAVVADEYDGESAAILARRLALPRVVLYRRLGSTMDIAHALGERGAPAGTLVLAEEQTAGRGRQGRSWRSAAGHGIWLTMLERPANPAGLEVLSLRVGLAVARVLDRHAPMPVGVKWPNDLFVGEGKLAGVLVEARWRGPRLDWVAIGLGVNVVAPPDVPEAAGLRADTSRLEVLAALVPTVRAAAAGGGALDSRELREFEARDHARGRRCAAPSAGLVLGVTPKGELAVATASGVRYHRTGALVLEEGA